MAAQSNGALAPIVFSFQSVDVRTFVDNYGEPWFCAKDVCKILGYTNAAKQ
jgi:prophage antirepressor-like protein